MRPSSRNEAKLSPATEHVVDWLGDGRRAGDFDALLAEPDAQIVGERATAHLPNLVAFVGAETIDLAFDGEERVNTFHHLQGGRRHGRGARPAPCTRGNVGELEEAATGMGPA